MRRLFFVSILFLGLIFTSVAGAADIKLMYFYEKGCNWCALMDNVLNDPSIRGILQQDTNVLKIDVHGVERIKGEGLTGSELAKKYGIRGTPTVIFLSAQGKELLRIPGAVTRDDFNDLLCNYVSGVKCKNNDCISR